MSEIRVRAVPGQRVPLRDAGGRVHMGRFVGVRADGTEIAEGVVMPETPALLAHVHRGELTVVADPAAAVPAPDIQPEAPPAPAPRRRGGGDS